MRKLWIAASIATTLSACAGPSLPPKDNSAFLAQENTLRQMSPPPNKAILYVVNGEETSWGSLTGYSGIKIKLGMIAPGTFHAFCLDAGDYSFTYLMGALLSSPLPIHLEANRAYGILATDGGSFFSPPILQILSREETQRYINMRRLDRPSYSQFEVHDSSPFRCDQLPSLK